MAGYALAKLLPGLIMFAAVPIWVHVFGPEEYGRYSVAWTLVGATSSLLNGWIRQSTLRYSGRADLRAAFLPSWLVPVLCLGGSVAIVVSVLVLFRDLAVSELAWLATATAAYLIASTINGISLAEAQRDGRSSRFATAEIARLAIALGISLVLSLQDVVSGASSILAAYALGAFVAHYILRQPDLPSLHEPDRSYVLRTYWHYGAPMAVWLFVSGLLVYIDRIIVSAHLGDEAAGQYAAVADLVIRGFGMATFPLTMATHPLVMQLWNAGSPERAVNTVRKYTTWLAGYTFVGCLLITLFGPTVLPVLLDGAPIDQATVGFLAAGAALWQVALMAHKPLELARRTGLMVILLSLALAVSVCTSISLINALGETAVAIGLTVGASLYNVAVLLAGRKQISRTLVKGRAI